MRSRGPKDNSITERDLPPRLFSKPGGSPSPNGAAWKGFDGGCADAVFMGAHRRGLAPPLLGWRKGDSHHAAPNRAMVERAN